MVTDFEQMAAELQLQIIQQEKALYSATVLEEARHPRDLRRMVEPDTCAIVRRSCGDTMEIYLDDVGRSC
jgi:hypothetical protein